MYLDFDQQLFLSYLSNKNYTIIAYQTSQTILPRIAPSPLVYTSCAARADPKNVSQQRRYVTSFSLGVGNVISGTEPKKYIYIYHNE